MVVYQSWQFLLVPSYSLIFKKSSWTSEEFLFLGGGVNISHIFPIAMIVQYATNRTVIQKKIPQTEQLLWKNSIVTYHCTFVFKMHYFCTLCKHVLIIHRSICLHVGQSSRSPSLYKGVMSGSCNIPGWNLSNTIYTSSFKLISM